MKFLALLNNAMILRVGARLQGREGLFAALGRTCGMGILRGTGILPVSMS